METDRINELLNDMKDNKLSSIEKTMWTEPDSITDKKVYLDGVLSDNADSVKSIHDIINNNNVKKDKSSELSMLLDNIDAECT